MHNVTLKPSGQQFQVEAGETILAAALRQGLVLPYGCKNGACGSCKGKILEGGVDYGVYQKRVFTDEEKAQGKARRRRQCACTARSRNAAMGFLNRPLSA